MKFEPHVRHVIVYNPQNYQNYQLVFSEVFEFFKSSYQL